MQIHEIFAVSETATPGVFAVDVELTDMEGDRYRCDYVNAPDDAFGLAPVIRQWLEDNPTFPVTAYLPPTGEQVRASMTALTRRQLKLALLQNGFLAGQVDATIEAMPDGPEKEIAKIEWADATTFERVHPLIISVGAAFGLTETQIDEMWTAAASL